MGEEFYRTTNWRGQPVIRSRKTWDYSGSTLQLLVGLFVGVPASAFLLFLFVGRGIGLNPESPEQAMALFILFAIFCILGVLALAFLYRRVRGRQFSFVFDVVGGLAFGLLLFQGAINVAVWMGRL